MGQDRGGGKNLREAVKLKTGYALDTASEKSVGAEAYE